MKRDDLKGITQRDCPAACTPEHCVISTVNICKHPYLQGDAGCGPITIENRELAKKVIKINQIEGEADAKRELGTARVRRDVIDRGGAKKAPRRRKKANAGGRRKRVPEGGQGQEDQPAREAREEEIAGD